MEITNTLIMIACVYVCIGILILMLGVASSVKRLKFICEREGLDTLEKAFFVLFASLYTIVFFAVLWPWRIADVMKRIKDGD